jgi:hypothetical protein
MIEINQKSSFKLFRLLVLEHKFKYLIKEEVMYF